MVDHSTIGKTVTEYTDNGRHIACLKKRLSDIGRDLANLGEALQSDPGSIQVNAGQVSITKLVRIVGVERAQAIHPSAFNLEALETILDDLAQAVEARERLEVTLRGLKLEELIRDA
jgi:hypothetical protein